MKAVQTILWILFFLSQLSVAQNVEKLEPQIRWGDSIADLSTTKKRAIKITPLAFIAGYTAFSFEKWIAPGRSYELKLGIIGLGQHGYDGAGQIGMTATAGHKFINRPFPGPERDGKVPPLRGWYFRPDLTVGCYKEKYINRVYTPNSNGPILKTESFLVKYVSFVPTFGVQMVRPWGLVTDFFVGFGIAVIDPINGNRVVDRGKYGYIIPLDKKKGEEPGVSYVVKLGFLMGLNF